MDEERPDEAIGAMCAGIDVFHEVGSAPHRDTHLAQEALRSCFAAFGNVHRVSVAHTDHKTDANEHNTLATEVQSQKTS